MIIDEEDIDLKEFLRNVEDHEIALYACFYYYHGDQSDDNPFVGNNLYRMRYTESQEISDDIHIMWSRALLDMECQYAAIRTQEEMNDFLNDEYIVELEKKTEQMLDTGEPVDCPK